MHTRARRLVRAGDAEFARLLELGAISHEAVRNVGGDIKVAAVLDPFGNVFAILENPHFDHTQVS